jgi:hypothetical protein
MRGDRRSTSRTFASSGFMSVGRPRPSWRVACIPNRIQLTKTGSLGPHAGLLALRCEGKQVAIQAPPDSRAFRAPVSAGLFAETYAIGPSADSVYPADQNTAERMQRDASRL